MQPIKVFMMDLLCMVPYYDGHLCEALAQEGRVHIQLGAITYHCDPCCFQRHAIPNEPGLLDIVSRLRLAPLLLRLLKVVETVMNMAALLGRFAISKPDVIHVQFIPMVIYVPLELWFLAAARAFGIKIVYTVHDMLPPNTGERYKKLYERIYHFADALICHGASAKDRLVREFGIPPSHIRVIPHGPFFGNGCSLTQHEARANLGLLPDECLVLWQGIVEPYKGITFLLQAWQQVCKKGLRARLAIVGNNSVQAKLQTIKDDVTNFDIATSVRLELRFVSVEELSSWYCAADIVTYPYGESTTSGALMTGINYGKPIVATTLPPFQQILRHGYNALLVDYGDVEGFSRELERLIQDEPLRRHIGEGVRASQANGPRWSDIATHTRECYEDLVLGPVQQDGARAS